MLLTKTVAQAERAWSPHLESTRFHLFGQSPSLEKDWLLPKNNKIDLFQVRGRAQCFPSEGDARIR